MKLIFWYIFRALAWFSLWNIIDFIEFLKSMLCRFKRGSQRAGPSDQPSASGLFLAQSLIEKLLLKINPTKAGGLDTIPCRFLRELAEELAPLLTLIFRQSERIRQYDSSDTGHSDNANIAAEHQEPAEVLSQLDNTSNSPVYGEYKCCLRGGLLCTFGGLWCRM